jgi:hypothetical protein
LVVVTPWMPVTLLFPPQMGAALTIGPTVVPTQSAPCHHGREVADLGRLPPALMFAPLDITPDLLAWTEHRAIGSGYHRNDAAIHRVMATFMADPNSARASVMASGARYVAGCPGENETELYKKNAPNGLWSRLERGDRFDWLQRVPIPGSPVLVWRVITPPSRAVTNLPLSDTARGP